MHDLEKKERELEVCKASAPHAVGNGSSEIANNPTRPNSTKKILKARCKTNESISIPSSDHLRLDPIPLKALRRSLFGIYRDRLWPYGRGLIPILTA